MPSTKEKQNSTTSKTKPGAKKATGSKEASGSQASSRPAGKSAGGSSTSKSAKSSSSSKTGASKNTKGSSSGSKRSSAKSPSATKQKKSPKSGSAGERTSDSGTSTAKGSSKRSSRSTASNGNGIVGRIASAAGSLLSGGKQDVLGLLKDDHRIVDGYFQEVKADEDANHEKTFKKIKAELDVHAHVEEVIFYPHLMEVGSGELKKIVREGVEEHGQVKTLLQELSELKGSDEVFKAKLKVLIENVEHHVEEEEGEMFSLVEDEVDQETLTLLAERVEKEKTSFGSKTKPRQGGRKTATA